MSSPICFVNCLLSLASSILFFFLPSGRTLAEDIMMQLSMAHAMTGNVAYLKAKVRWHFPLVFCWDVYTCKIQCNRSVKRVFFGHKLCISRPYFLQNLQWFCCANCFSTLKFKVLLFRVKGMFIIITLKFKVCVVFVSRLCTLLAAVWLCWQLTLLLIQSLNGKKLRWEKQQKMTRSKRGWSKGTDSPYMSLFQS